MAVLHLEAPTMVVDSKVPTMAVLQAKVLTTMWVDAEAPTMAVLDLEAPNMAVDSEVPTMVLTTMDKVADADAPNKAAQFDVPEAKEVRLEERENAKIKVKSSPSFVRW